MPLNQTIISCPKPRTLSSQLIRRLLNIEYSSLLLASNSLILQHPIVDSRILSLKLEHRLWRDSFKDKVVIAVWAVFIAILELRSVLSEGLFALLAGEYLFNHQIMAG